IAYGPSITEPLARAAGFVYRILNGAKPADLPVEQPTKFQLVVNLKTAKTLGLTIPASLLARAGCPRGPQVEKSPSRRRSSRPAGRCLQAKRMVSYGDRLAVRDIAAAYTWHATRLSVGFEGYRSI